MRVRFLLIRVTTLLRFARGLLTCAMTLLSWVADRLKSGALPSGGWGSTGGARHSVGRSEQQTTLAFRTQRWQGNRLSEEITAFRGCAIPPPLVATKKLVRVTPRPGITTSRTFLTVSGVKLLPLTTMFPSLFG